MRNLHDIPREVTVPRYNHAVQLTPSGPGWYITDPLNGTGFTTTREITINFTANATNGWRTPILNNLRITDGTV